MQRAWPYDIAVASVLGGVLALTLALTFGLSPFLWSFLGLVIGPLCYKPQEIASTTMACTSDLWKVMREGGLQRLFPHTSVHRLWEGVKNGAFVVGCAICIMLSFVALPYLVMLPLVFLGWPSITEAEGGIVISTAFVSLILGFFGVGILLNVPECHRRWVMPLSRRVVLPLFRYDGFVPLKSPTNDATHTSTKKDILGMCLLPIPILQVGALLIPVLVLDLLITIALACASTRRIASMLGSTLFCTGAAVAALCGITSAPVLLLIGGIIGWFAGPSLYLLREYLAAAPSTVPVQS